MRARDLVPAGALSLQLLTGSASAQPSKAKPEAHEASASAVIEEIVVIASRLNLLGHADTASQGVVTKRELELRPVYRVGQLLETVPGLVVSVHSGEGKAYQYLARGFNLDHGTDLATFIDGIPVNRPTDAHGQGYSDLNFLIPEMVSGLDYTKGPYFASLGDFGAVASVHLKLADTLPNQLISSIGSLGDERIAGTGMVQLGDESKVLGAFDISHLDGPFTPPNNFRKIAGGLRFVDGTEPDGFTLTALYYHGEGRLSTDQPERAVEEGLITRFGTLDPTDGSLSERESLSGHYATVGDGWQVATNAYAVHSLQTLKNDFTHFLNDPVNGDQEQQDENRTTLGGDSSFTFQSEAGSIKSDTTIGVQGRYDDAYVDKRHTKDGRALDYCDVLGVPYVVGPYACNADLVQIGDTGLYAQNKTFLTEWLRTVLGVREEFYSATDRSLITGFKGNGAQTLLQPKGSLILGPWLGTELYISGGRGFHSDDVRGVFQTLPLEGIPGASHRTPLLARANGEEIGLRSMPMSGLNIQVAVFQIEFGSELIYDQDMGMDQANAPSKRRGIEASAQYRPLPWLELNTDLAATKARFVTGEPASYGLNGRYIADAPDFIGAVGALADGPGKWYGGLQWRILGSYPLNPDNLVRGKGYSEVNVDVGYRLAPRTKVELSIYNLFNQRADAFDYDYVSRLPGEPLGGITNERDDLQFHPIEPLSARVMLTQEF